MSTYEIVKLINDEDKTVAYAVEQVLDEVSQAIDIIASSLKSSGRLIYIGSGTSGRLGVLDASECPPTYGTDPEMVQGIIAGGKDSMFKAKENAEDDYQKGAEDLKMINFKNNDICFGISASGNAKYVLGAFDYAKSIGAKTIALTCNKDTEMEKVADLAITPITGPEVITGSTRMKAGTAQKLVLNMVSTGVMIRLNRTYGNYMQYMKPKNEKLYVRAVRTVADILGISLDEATLSLEKFDGSIEECLKNSQINIQDQK